MGFEVRAVRFDLKKKKKCISDGNKREETNFKSIRTQNTFRYDKTKTSCGSSVDISSKYDPVTPAFVLSTKRMDPMPNCTAGPYCIIAVSQYKACSLKFKYGSSLP